MTSPNTQPLDLDTIEARKDAASRGPWTLSYATCDCSEDCGHGLYVSRINTGSGPATELVDLPREDWELMVHAREDVDALVAEVRRLRARQLTESEYSAAWHAVEGAAGEEGADPGTVLHAVLDRLGINLPAARPAGAANEDNKR